MKKNNWELDLKLSKEDINHIRGLEEGHLYVLEEMAEKGLKTLVPDLLGHYIVHFVPRNFYFQDMCVYARDLADRFIKIWIDLEREVPETFSAILENVEQHRKIYNTSIEKLKQNIDKEQNEINEGRKYLFAKTKGFEYLNDSIVSNIKANGCFKELEKKWHIILDCCRYTYKVVGFNKKEEVEDYLNNFLPSLHNVEVYNIYCNKKIVPMKTQITLGGS